MHYFNYEAYLELAEKIRASKDAYAAEDLEVLNNAITNFRKYVEDVNDGEQMVQFAAYRLKEAEYRDAIKQYDTTRHLQHEAAIAMVRVVNRLAAAYGVNNLFTGNDQARLEVADFCLDVVVELFKHRKL